MYAYRAHPMLRSRCQWPRWTQRVGITLSRTQRVGITLSPPCASLVPQLFLHSVHPFTSNLKRNVMSWSCQPESNDGLVDALVEAHIIRSPEVEEAMRAVDRRNFSQEPQVAYADCPHPIGYGATISAPHMHAHCLEMLRDRLFPGAKVLDIGSGSGYLTAVMAHMVTRGGAAGRAVGVDHIPQLVDQAVRNVGREPQAARLVQSGSLLLEVGDGQKGWPAEAPYDAIHAGAAAAEIPPALCQQLKPGGRLLLPVGPAGGVQSMALIEKTSEGKLHRRDAMSVMYVPLTDREAQLQGGWDTD